MADAGTYKVIVKDQSGQEVVSEEVTLSVNKHAPPIINRQPQDTTIVEGEGRDAILDVAITTAGSSANYGDYCLFEWSKDNISVMPTSAASNYLYNYVYISNSSAYIIQNPTPSDSGAYSVSIKNRWGGVTISATVKLIVRPSPTAPVVLANPADVAVMLERDGNGSAAFAVTATYAMNYQWLKDGQPLVASDRNKVSEDYGGTIYFGSGTKSNPVQRPKLSIAGLRASDAGQYSVMVWNSTGTTISQPATLAITQPHRAVSGTQAVTLGRDISLSSALPANSQIPVQWQVSSNGGKTWQNVTDNSIYSGANTGVLQITGATDAMNNYKYRYTTNGQAASAYSDPVTLAVGPNLFPHPVALAYYSGILFVADDSLHTIQAIDLATGHTRTIAGKAGMTGSNDGLSESARFNQPRGLAVNADGTLFVTDAGNGLIRAIAPDGKVTTVAGSASMRGSADGNGASATFTMPTALWVDPTTSIAEIRVADFQAHTLRFIDAGSKDVSTLAGIPAAPGYVDGDGAQARFNHPSALVRLYRSEYVFYRKDNPWLHWFGLGATSTVIFYNPTPKFLYNATYMADSYNHAIRYCIEETAYSGIKTNTVNTLVGLAGVSGSDDGEGLDSRFNEPGGMTVDTSDNMYVADTGNSTIRLIRPPAQTYTIAGLPGVTGHKDGMGYDAWFNHPTAITLGPRVIYIADTGNASIRIYNLDTSEVTTLDAKIAPATTGTGNNTNVNNGSITSPGTQNGSGGGGMTSTLYLLGLPLLVFCRCLRSAMNGKHR